ncbi:MAG TPA: helix-turn-helix domain-containing protein [Nakamurella sp.]|jgi:AcrR family transcriptional regulator
MSRAFRQQTDDGILDRAAALFARQGLRKTSVQDIATAVGLSKAGLLHHFPTKEGIHDAVLALAGTLGERLIAQVDDLPVGPARDRRALESVIDIAAGHPGVVSFLLAPAIQPDPAATPDSNTAAAVLGVFGVDPETTDTDRLVRVIGALSALAVLTIAAHHSVRGADRGADQSSAWRPHILQTCFDALGHPST